MKRLLVGGLMLLSFATFGQTYAKFNLATPFIGGVNPSIETAISSKWTFSFDVLATFKNENESHGPFRILMVMPEGRYYLKEKFKGFYAGINAGYAISRMTKPDWWGEDYAEQHIYDVAWTIVAGFTVGYEYNITDRWMAEIFVGGGRAWTMHEQFIYPDGGRPDKNGKPVKLNGSEEYLPYKGGINISYRLGK